MTDTLNQLIERLNNDVCTCNECIVDLETRHNLRRIIEEMNQLKEPAMQNEIKVGDQVRVLPDAGKKTEPLFGWGKSFDVILDKVFIVKAVDSDCVKIHAPETGWTGIYVALSGVEKVTQESLEMVEAEFPEVEEAAQVKLEVGVKYDIPYWQHNGPFTFICDKKCFGYTDNKDPLVFINKDGVVEEFTTEDIGRIKKHSEPFKQKISGYFIYNERRGIQPGTLGDIITNKYIADVFCSSFEEAKTKLDPRTFDKIGKIEGDFTVHYDIEE